MVEFVIVTPTGQDMMGLLFSAWEDPMTATMMLLILCGLASWSAVRRPSVAMILCVMVILLLTATKLLGLHLLLGERLTLSLKLHGAAGLAAPQLGNLLAEAALGGGALALTAIAAGTARRRLARSAVFLTFMLTGGMALAAGIDLWNARDATTPYQLSLFALLEDELEAYTALGALLGWAALCIAPTIQVERHRRAATNTYPMYP